MTHTIEQAIEAYKSAEGDSLKRVMALINAGFPSKMAVDASWLAEKGVQAPQTQGNAYGAGRDFNKYEKSLDRSIENN